MITSVDPKTLVNLSMFQGLTARQLAGLAEHLHYRTFPAGTPIITAERTNLCATSYPVINNINGELYIYYDYIWPDGRNWILRSKLIWNNSSGTPTTTPTGTQIDGDFTGDGKVNIVDFVLFMNYWFFNDLKGDLNGDGKLSAIDYTVFMNYWYSYNQSH